MRSEVSGNCIEWDSQKVDNLRAFSMGVLLPASICLGVAWYVFFGTGITLGMFFFLAIAAIRTPMSLDQYIQSQKGSTVRITTDAISFDNPNDGHSIEFHVKDVEGMRTINWAIFSYIKFTLKDNKYFTLYFYDVERIQIEVNKFLTS